MSMRNGEETKIIDYKTRESEEWYEVFELGTKDRNKKKCKREGKKERAKENMKGSEE